MTAAGMDLAGVLIDGVMVVAIIGLWWLWYTGRRRQEEIERKLEAASAELQEASKQLNALMPLLTELCDPRPSPPPPSRSVVTPRKAQPAATSAPAADGGAAKGDARLAQVLRLRREGADAEEIARQVDLPLAQVKLLLRLHARSVES